MRTTKDRTRVPRIARVLVFFSLLFAPTLCRAQEEKAHVRERRVATQPEEVGPDEVVRVETDLVPVEVTVRDGAGQVVRGLRSGDFKLFEDGVERPINFFRAETTGGEVQCPLDLIFALDVSGSMRLDEMEMLRAAAALFVERLAGPQSRFAVISFGMSAKVLQSFTGDARRLDKAFGSASQDEMGTSTHAFDAVDDAVRMLVRKGRGTSGGPVVKRVVIVISDGFPTGDTVAPRTVIERANAANVTVYSVTMPSYSFGYAAAEGQPLPTIFDLSGIVEETGGVNVYATDRNYADALKAVSKEVLSRYVLAFYPDRQKRRDGSFHKLRIEAHGGMTVSQSRHGYAGKDLR